MVGYAAGIQFDLMRSRHTPLYMQLASQLHKGLRRGLWTAHEPLPSERVLSDALKVSRDTARKALALLCQRGLLKRVRGSGTFPSTFQGPASSPRRRASTAPQMSLATANAEELLTLGLSPNAKVLRCSHLRGGGGEAEAWVISSLPQVCMPLVGDDLSDREAYFRSKGWGETRVLERVRAVCANAQQAEQLAVPEGTALLHVMQIRYARSGLPLELCHVYWLGATADYCVELRRTPEPCPD